MQNHAGAEKHVQVDKKNRRRRERGAARCGIFLCPADCTMSRLTITFALCGADRWNQCGGPHSQNVWTQSCIFSLVCIALTRPLILREPPTLQTLPYTIFNLGNVKIGLGDLIYLIYTTEYLLYLEVRIEKSLNKKLWRFLVFTMASKNWGAG